MGSSSSLCDWKTHLPPLAAQTPLGPWARGNPPSRPGKDLGVPPPPQEERRRVVGEQLPLPQVTDGCGSPLHRLRSPLHSGPGSPAGGSFCLEPPGLRRSLDEDEPPPSPLARYRPLHNAASHEGLAAASGSPPRSAPSSDSSPSFVRRHPRAEPHSEGERQPAQRPLPAISPVGQARGGGIGGTGWLDGTVERKDHGSFPPFPSVLRCARHWGAPGHTKEHADAASVLLGLAVSRRSNQIISYTLRRKQSNHPLIKRIVTRCNKCWSSCCGSAVSNPA